jgi:putative phosphoesterase
MDLVVVADTHLRGGLEHLPERLLLALRHCDAIVHAGDIVSRQALEDLRRLAPVYAVLGNNDHELVGELPEQLRLELEGVQLAVLHDSGALKGRAGRMSRRFPGAQIVVFGHSHVPVDEEGAGGQLLFNPGSPTQRRAQPRPTFGSLRLERGHVAQRCIEPLDVPLRRVATDTSGE